MSAGQLLSDHRPHSFAASARLAGDRDNFPEAIDPARHSPTTDSSPACRSEITCSAIRSHTSPASTYSSPHFRNTEMAPWVPTIGASARPYGEPGPALRMERAVRHRKRHYIERSFSEWQRPRLYGARIRDGLPRALVYQRWGDFAPRVGFAWNPQAPATR